nr:hypothetical protein [Tanacetum cinerariifolium]
MRYCLLRNQEYRGCYSFGPRIYGFILGSVVIGATSVLCGGFYKVWVRNWLHSIFVTMHALILIMLLPYPWVPSCSKQLDHVGDEVHDLHSGFTLALLDNLFSKGLRTVKSIPMKYRLGFSRALKGALDKVICKPDDIYCWVLRETLAESSPTLSDVDNEDINFVRVLSSFGVAPYSDATLEDLKIKHPFKHAPSLPHIPFDHHHLIASSIVVLDRIKSFPRGISCGLDSLRAQYLIDYLIGSVVAISNELVSSITQVVNLSLGGSCPKMLGEYIASAPLTLLVKPGGGIRPIAIGTVWRCLISKVSALMIGHSLDGYLDDLQFGVRVSGGSEAILHDMNCLIEGHGDDVVGGFKK